LKTSVNKPKANMMMVQMIEEEDNDDNRRAGFIINVMTMTENNTKEDTT
jgi:hypothetical protein